MNSQRMSFMRGALAVAAATGGLALAGPVSGASAQITPFGFPGGGVPGPVNGIGPSLCPTPGSTIGPAGGTTATSCGDGLVFVGPAVGQISTTMGPTIIAGTVNVLAPITVSAGPASVSSVP
jgi:hypothetical protein